MVERCGELRYTDPTDVMRGTQAYRHGPSPRERMAEQRRLDTPIPSWEDIDTRIGQWLEVERQKFEQTLAARLEEEREFWHGVTARALAKILDDVEQRPGRRGRQLVFVRVSNLISLHPGCVVGPRIITINCRRRQLRMSDERDWYAILRFQKSGILSLASCALDNDDHAARPISETNLSKQPRKAGSYASGGGGFGLVENMRLIPPVACGNVLVRTNVQSRNIMITLKFLSSLMSYSPLLHFASSTS
jgi:hypothetical protein